MRNQTCSEFGVPGRSTGTNWLKCVKNAGGDAYVRAGHLAHLKPIVMMSTKQRTSLKLDMGTKLINKKKIRIGWS